MFILDLGNCRFYVIDSEGLSHLNLVCGHFKSRSGWQRYNGETYSVNGEKYFHIKL